jgi:putative FmdB family regulatory protein
MPIYPYVCKLCGNYTEILEKHADKSVCCPKCLNNELERVVGAGAFTFKNPAGTTQKRGWNNDQ